MQYCYSHGLQLNDILCECAQCHGRHSCRLMLRAFRAPTLSRLQCHQHQHRGFTVPVHSLRHLSPHLHPSPTTTLLPSMRSLRVVTRGTLFLTHSDDNIEFRVLRFGLCIFASGLDIHCHLCPPRLRPSPTLTTPLFTSHKYFPRIQPHAGKTAGADSATATEPRADLGQTAHSPVPNTWTAFHATEPQSHPKCRRVSRDCPRQSQPQRRQQPRPPLRSECDA